tara:strand:+ start:42 stop:1370 length:1329 start_codon:yes stop_codon:yes gene_type:complete
MKNKYIEEKKTFSFDKNISLNVFYAKPDKYKLLEKISSEYDEIINIGSNLSYSPLGISKNGVTLELKKFNRILQFNKNEKTITVEAGITLYEFLNFTLKENLWIPQLPGYPTITVGGAVAANSHGKSCFSHGTIRKSIKNILLFHKTNGWIELSKNKNADIFDLTIGGLGLTGSIVNVTFNLSKIESSVFTTKKISVNSIKETQEHFVNENNNNSFLYSWHRADNINNFGKGIIYKNDIKVKSNGGFDVLKIKNNKFKPLIFPFWNKFSIRFINFVFLLLNKLGKNEKRENFLNVIFPFYGKENYFNFFGNNGFLETQLLIKEKFLFEFLDEFKNLYEIYKPTITLFSLKNMSGAQSLIRFEDNKMCITFDFIKNKSSLSFMEEVDKLYLKYEILPSVIKDSRIKKEIFYDSYKHAKEFKDRLYEFDKKRSYKSEVSKRLEL